MSFVIFETENRKITLIHTKFMKIKRISLLLIAVFTAGIIYGNINDADRSNSYFEEIKFEFINNKIIIPVTINGTEYRFLFDTGAPNVISKEVLQNANHKILKIKTISDATGNSDELNVVSIPEIVIGNTPFRNTKALVYDIKNNDVFKCFNIDGFIGSNLLKNSIVQIDFETKKLTITNSKRTLNLDKSKATKMELIGEQKSPFIFIEINGGRKAKDQVLIDTGMDTFYDISKRSYNIFKDNDILKVLATAKGGNIISLFGNAEESEQHRILVPELKVAEISFLKLVTTTTTDNISRIGTEMLKHGIVTIDYRNKRFYFDAKEQVIDVSKPLPGVSPTFIDNKLVVGYVWDEELKEKISYGDEITKINEWDITGMKNCDFLSLQQEFEHKDTLNIEYKNRAGENSKLTIIKKIPKDVTKSDK